MGNSMASVCKGDIINRHAGVCASTGEVRAVQVTVQVENELLLVHRVGPANGSRLRRLTRAPRNNHGSQFTLGHDVEADLPLADPALPAQCFPLVTTNDRQHVLLFTAAMHGQLSVAGQPTPLAELIEEGLATPEPRYANTYAFPISHDTRVLMQLGRHLFSICAVSDDTRVPTSWVPRIDWRAQAATAASMVAHTLVLLAIFGIPPDAKALTLDLFEDDHLQAPYLVRPQILQPVEAGRKGPPKPEAVRVSGQRGTAGKIGRRKAHSRHDGRLRLPGAAEQLRPSRELAREQAHTAGLLGELAWRAGSPISSILARGNAIGPDAETALGSLIGDVGEEPYGSEGLGLDGRGRSGGGFNGAVVAQGRLPTLGKGGQGGDGSSVPAGAVATLRSRVAGVPDVVPGHARLRGALDKDIVRRYVRRHIREVRYCYSKVLQASSNVGGRLVTRFVIDPTGRVIISQMERSTVGNREVEQCIVAAIRRWRFPKPNNGGTVIVTYPFVLRAAGQS